MYVLDSTDIQGTDDPQIRGDGESPKRKVRLDPFLLDQYEVSNLAYAAFVLATGFVTESERFGWSFVFHSAIADEVSRFIYKMYR